MVAPNEMLSYIRPALMDTFSRKERSEIMRRVRSKGTRPELTVRRLVKQMGIKYRCSPGNLPGKPDLVLDKQRKAIFVHGCFWHGHSCEAGRLPRANRSYWKNKQIKNYRRDLRNARALRRNGWSLLTLWECELRKKKVVDARVTRFVRAKS